MTKEASWQILLFYKYVYIADPEVVRDWLRALCEKFDLKGRLIVASEGINCTLEGTKEHTEAFIKELETDARFSNIHFKRSVGTGNAFPRLSVKTRSEIVTLGLGVCDIDPNQLTGIHLKPEELHRWIADGKEFYIVDMRNAYEHGIGRFKGSECPPMNHFRDLPKFIKSLAHLKDKTVLTVCTGGVRCEKASGYLLLQGFKDVYQLDGGIVSYMEKYPNEDFEGKLYVFDRRVAMGFYTDDPKRVIVGRCAQCNVPSERMVDCRSGTCNGQFIICDSCEKTQIQKKGMTYCPKGCTQKQQSSFVGLFATLKSLFR
ncbi:MAG TPA: rhodanese-related sulfurtransferase [Candidatus Paceibacterota bacterium]|nr:rhodanese-related sulfurtransferase [Candidatus Paceibacterota bacterium]